ncbi:hypothetical protein ATL17_2333 [Maritalea mobilis]|uniref:Uncharacterized protein n=1 Tax=Maritalea mobilis TaxID=483324 RepID=A0A4R6VQ25_9HYPH|nr:DUF6384 family protein [Maritalea mobilis]TDQ64316.1 hypothetical protein ATL17_2333 [Maritalea mobilis]
MNKDKSLPLDDVMMAMDVVDTLRHRNDLVARELNEENRASTLVDRLREIYHQQGIDVPDHILQEGVNALKESRFTYNPPTGGFGYMLARAYVSRGRWGKWVLGVGLALGIGLSGYFLVYQPMQAGQAAATQTYLSTELPAQFDQLVTQIEATAKVDAANTQAAELADRGKLAASAGDQVAAEKFLSDLNVLLSTLQSEYRVQVVNREGADTGVWTYPDVNQDARNYYIIVEAIGPDGNILPQSITNEESGLAETVEQWGVRVSEVQFEAIRDDKLDDGIIQNNIMGLKEFGYLNVDYTQPVLGGAITKW